jgi:hypothetical protein
MSRPTAVPLPWALPHGGAGTDVSTPYRTHTVVRGHAIASRHLLKAATIHPWGSASARIRCASGRKCNFYLSHPALALQGENALQPRKTDEPERIVGNRKSGAAIENDPFSSSPSFSGKDRAGGKSGRSALSLSHAWVERFRQNDEEFASAIRDSPLRGTDGRVAPAPAGPVRRLPGLPALFGYSNPVPRTETFEGKASWVEPT